VLDGGRCLTNQSLGPLQPCYASARQTRVIALTFVMRRHLIWCNAPQYWWTYSPDLHHYTWSGDVPRNYTNNLRVSHLTSLHSLLTSLPVKISDSSGPRRRSTLLPTFRDQKRSGGRSRDGLRGLSTWIADDKCLCRYPLYPSLNGGSQSTPYGLVDPAPPRRLCKP